MIIISIFFQGYRSQSFRTCKAANIALTYSNIPFPQQNPLKPCLQLHQMFCRVPPLQHRWLQLLICTRTSKRYGYGEFPKQLVSLNAWRFRHCLAILPYKKVQSIHGDQDVKWMSNLLTKELEEFVCVAASTLTNHPASQEKGQA